ncbi:carbohydrate kinase [Prevotella denticola]|uniref:carbohydrate kinase family protein n=1 Tax=Prevotella denticola TaxID=28129 RepID=UPI00020131DE|nr:carbohydrate kinase [Prevotella denticola]AEA22126.1 kinase, PfkB family [Prevotella denticola F0289]AXV49262.1 carbohydrate kinase [Prevotella denticola]KGF43222.1 fructokinase [Prevotella denticola DNF00960]QUB88326.1 carbohydrate kinase [Prevotella denticola]QUB92617.1 carbohydrate kinase [Prevotella denticola]
MRKVIGIGEAVLDIIFKDNKPVEAVPGGSAFNAITSLGRCGVSTSFISEAGNDHVGKYIIEFLKSNGVNADNVTTFPDSKSPVSLAFLNEKNDAEYIFYKDHPHDQLEFTYPDIQPDDIVLFGSFYAVNPVIRPQLVGLLDYARSHGAIIYYDVNFRPAHKDEVIRITPNLIENLDYADIVRGSHEDFATLYKKEDADKVYNAEISFYCRQFIYTHGSQPVEVRGGRDMKKSYPVPDTKVVSTIGAGDSFNAGFIFGMLKQGITRSDLERGLTGEQWDSLIGCALSFSADCCKDIFNYVSKKFGEKMKK